MFGSYQAPRVGGMREVPERRLGLPAARLDPRQIPPEHRFDAWREGVAPLFDCAPVTSPRSFSASASAYGVDGLRFARLTFDAARFRRWRHHLADDGSDPITLQLYKSGKMRGMICNDVQMRMGPGAISVQDFAHAYAGIGKSSEYYIVLIPRDRITPRGQVYRMRPLLSLGLDQPAGRILSNTLSTVWNELPSARPQDAPVLAEGLVALLNALLTHEMRYQTHPAAQLATREAMDAYIRENLHRGDLIPDELCRKFGCSRATLYRLFKDDGGFHTYLRDQRLINCFRELCGASPGTRLLVRTVAEKWGFRDSARFSRLFKTRFGHSPSEALGSATEPPAARIGGRGQAGDVNVQRLRDLLAG